MNEVSVCPFCASEMLVQHKSASSSKSVTPEDEGSPSSETLSPPGSSLPSRPSSALPLKRTNSVVLLADEPEDDEETILPPPSFHTPAVSPESALADLSKEALTREDSSEETLFVVQSIESTMSSLQSSMQSLHQKEILVWNFEDFNVLDHRLRLHIDMNILSAPNEEFMMATKVVSVMSFDIRNICLFYCFLR